MIGIFDSGVGGLTVVKEVKEVMSDATILYLGDTARVPYGGKSKEIILKYSFETVAFLLSNGAQIIVIGCNTASTNAAKEIQEKYPHIPVYDVITPAIKKAAMETKNKKIGIIGTESTIASHIYRRELTDIDSSFLLSEKKCPLFVPLVEENRMHTPETKRIIASYLESFVEDDIDTLILGCTHYPYLREDIYNYFKENNKKVYLVDTGHELAQQLKEDVNNDIDLKNKINHTGEDQFFLTDITPPRKDLARKLFNEDIHFNKAMIN